MRKGLKSMPFLARLCIVWGYISGDEYVSSDQLPKERHTMINALIGKYIDSKNQKFRFQVQTGIGLLLVVTKETITASPGSISIEKTIGPRRTLGFPVKVGGRFFSLFLFEHWA